MIAVSRLKGLRHRKKIGTALIFATGFLAIIASILSIVYRVILNRTVDYTWYLVPLYTVMTAELYIGVIIACTPHIAKFIRRYEKAFSEAGSVIAFYLCCKPLSRKGTESKESRKSSEISDTIESARPMKSAKLYPGLDVTTVGGTFGGTVGGTEIDSTDEEIDREHFAAEQHLAAQYPAEVHWAERQKEMQERFSRAIGRVNYDTTGQLLSPSEESRYTFGWTDLAKKYSRPVGKFASLDHRVLGDGGKSGLTPRVPASKSDDGKGKEKRFNGFTTFDLHSMQALAALDTNIYIHGLENPIHPCFERSKWVVENDMPKHKGAIPILGREEGFWMADNPVVWNLLKPCLQLATLMLHNECKYSWLDALLNVNYDDVPNSPEGMKLQRFFSRTHEERTKQLPQTLEKLIQDLTNVVIFGFNSGYEDVETGLPSLRTSRNAITGDHSMYDRIKVLISTEMAQPLLRDDLTDAEKMGNRLRIATTFVHEFAIWGGQPTPLITQIYNRGGPGLPNLGIIKTSWFTDKNKDYQTSRKAPPLIRKPKRGQVDRFYIYDYWPVPTSWYGTLLTEAFWGNVREFGPEAKKMRIEKLGVRFLSTEHPDAKAQIDDGGINIGGGWSYGAPQTRSQTERFRTKSKISTILSKQLDGVKAREDHDPLDQWNVRPPIVTYSCPRWSDIAEYLFNNRGPLDLGWEPFPGFGVVKRIATGWPPLNPGSDSISWPSPIGEPDEEDIDTLDNLMSDQAVQEALKWLVHRFEAQEFNGEDAVEDFRDIIWETVRRDGAYFTLGPKNIVRCIYPIMDIRDEKANAFTKERMKMLEERAESATSKV
ncbi:hypothetical protein SBOR_7842 [Sclerotinia borealis F-4128]|uniref:Rhodopsin domain-containing protein n=1 Tax=Sclerotinia borealis (strain F-4128) TaxID=1432307 RepID=W9C4S9_SCLBF|nr:hypothetical protein SBOR_7842 [Sclerotinia borealis F-4128]